MENNRNNRLIEGKKLREAHEYAVSSIMIPAEEIGMELYTILIGEKVVEYLSFDA